MDAKGDSKTCLGKNAANILISNSISKTINYIDFPKPPKYFEVSIMLHHDENHKTLDLEMCNWPVVITGEGFQSAAGDDLATKIGLILPNVRCRSHADDGSLKRMANSKTINVGAV